MTDRPSFSSPYTTGDLELIAALEPPEKIYAGPPLDTHVAREMRKLGEFMFREGYNRAKQDAMSALVWRPMREMEFFP